MRTMILIAVMMGGCVASGAEGAVVQAVAGPGGVTVTPRPEAGQLAVSWTADPAATQYRVMRSSGQAFALVATVFDSSGGTPTTSYIDTGLTPGAQYCYAIVSIYADASTSSLGTAGCSPAPGQPPGCQIAVSRVAGQAVRLAIASACTGDGWSLNYRMISSAGGLASATVRDRPCGAVTSVETLITGQLPLTDLVVTGWIFNPATGRIDCTVTAQ